MNNFLIGCFQSMTELCESMEPQVNIASEVGEKSSRFGRLGELSPADTGAEEEINN